MSEYGLIGNGSWATAIAKILVDNGHSIGWWMRKEEAISAFREKQHNPTYLSSVKFDTDRIDLSANILDIFGKYEKIIVCIPSAYLYDVIKDIPAEAYSDKIIISAVKGVLPEYNSLLNDYLVNEKNFDVKRYACITGPCHAEEVALERLSYLTFSSPDISVAESLSRDFRNAYLNTIPNRDIIGTQYAAVLKNIYAVGAGMVHGLGYGDNFLSVYTTNCYREMNLFLENICTKLGNTFDIKNNVSSAYLGDLLVTCYSLHSRNRRFGNLLGQGYSVKSAITEMGLMAEGYHASKGMQGICSRHTSHWPIIQTIYEILWESHYSIRSKIKTLEAQFL